MPELRLGYVRIVRDTGAIALVRPDAITHILHNVVVKKVGQEKVEVPMLALHLGQSLVIQTEMSEEKLLKAMAHAVAINNIPVIDPDTDA